MQPVSWLQRPPYSRIIYASFEDRDKIIRRCADHNVLSLNEKLHCPLAAEGAFDHPIWGCLYLYNELAKLCSMAWVSRVKAEISRMFADFSAQLSLRNLCVPPWLAM
jgi:hypothetical protein